MDLHKIKELMTQLMQDRYQHPDRGLGDAFFHCERVAKLAVDLRKQIFPNDDSHDEILTVAGWFHDMGKGSPEHARFGAVMAREALHDFCSSDELDEICEIIRYHDDRGHSEYSPWVKLHQDADVLDHHGTYFIWCSLSYRAWRHEGNISKFAGEQLDIYNYKTKILKLINYDFSRSICEEKLDYQNAFWERLKAEANGEMYPN
ncbi:MAG: HD domain-containing protein [Lachnospiraceae bacterium]|nr:HD domain-containing protein [Lachnospiraceae bacterium]